MAAGSMSQSRDKVAGARVFYRGTEPPPPIGPSLPYKTFPNVCPPPQPAQRWGHFWEKCHTAHNKSASFRAKKETVRMSFSTLCPFCSFSFLRRNGLVTAASLASIWSNKEEHAARPGRIRPKQHFFRENPSWCFEGCWERKCRWLNVQKPPSYFCSTSKFTAVR